LPGQNSGTLLPVKGLGNGVQGSLDRTQLVVKEFVELAQRIAMAGKPVQQRSNLFAATFAHAKQAHATQPQ
jgi:hypothetical protein